jgi:Mg2+-importing ATPase
VDSEQLARPAAWDIHFIRRFMLFFGPISSIFDFATFAVMLGVFHAGPAQFRSGWFVESLATQTLVIFAVRTRRIPFFRSRPSAPLLASALGIVVIGALVPSMPFASTLGFGALPTGFFVVLVLLAACYLGLIELGKRWFYRAAPLAPARTTVGARERRIGYRILRRARRFSSAGGNR